MEETGKPPGAIRFRDRIDPAAQERLALAVHEDVGPPQGMLEELEPLLGDVRRDSGPPHEVVEGLLAWGTVRVEHQRCVHP